jgi:hypothetical protein
MKNAMNTMTGREAVTVKVKLKVNRSEYEEEDNESMDVD